MSQSFQRELEAWGPAACASRLPVALSDAEAYCRNLARAHYENFPVVSWLLPRRLHQHFYNLYAFCRWSDDLGDEVGDPARSLDLQAWWRGELRRCYAGRAAHPVFIALGPSIESCNIPQQPFDDLISAFEQDQRVREYDTFEQLRDYCRRSADPVGRLILYVCGQFNEQNAAWSDSICTGLQLANFWQDVSRDYDIGRVYLPREDRDRFGYTEADLAARRTNAAFLRLMEFEVERAAEWLTAGLPLASALPGTLQVDIEMFARGGLKILERIRRLGYRVWDTRPTLTKRDALGLLLRCSLRAAGRWTHALRGQFSEERSAGSRQAVG